VSLHDGIAVAHDQTRATWNLEMVQRHRIHRFLFFPITMTKYFRRLDVRQVQRERDTRFVFIYSQFSA
jgi:hypothetical protein